MLSQYYKLTWRHSLESITFFFNILNFSISFCSYKWTTLKRVTNKTNGQIALSLNRSIKLTIPHLHSFAGIYFIHSTCFLVPRFQHLSFNYYNLTITACWNVAGFKKGTKWTLMNCEEFSSLRALSAGQRTWKTSPVTGQFSHKIEEND